MLWVGAPLRRLRRPQERGGGLLPLRHDAHPRQRRERGAHERRPATSRRVLGRFYETVVARWMAIVWQHGHLTWITNAVGPMIPIVPLLFARAQVHLGRALARPGDAARRRLHPGADRHLLGGRQLQPRGRVVCLGAPGDGHRRCLRCHRSAHRRHLSRRRAGPGRGQAPPCAFTDFEIADGSGRPLLARRRSAPPAPARPCTSTAISSTGKSTLGARAGGPVAGRARQLCAARSVADDDHPAEGLPAAQLAQGRAALSQSIAAGVRRQTRERRSARSASRRSCPGSTRSRAGTRCSPTASASA